MFRTAFFLNKALIANRIGANPIHMTRHGREMERLHSAAHLGGGTGAPEELRYGSTSSKIDLPEGMSLETMLEAIRIIDEWDEEKYREEEVLARELFKLFKCRRENEPSMP